MSNFQFVPVTQSFSEARGVEEQALENVFLNRAIDATVPNLYNRLVVKLHAMDGWDTRLIAEHAGVTREDISETLKGLRPLVMAAVNLA